jgi:hypothetical protein
MNTANIIIQIIVGIIGLFFICFVIVIVEYEIECKKIEKKWKEDAEKRKGQYETANLNIDQEPKKNLTIKNITENFDKCNENETSIIVAEYKVLAK